MFCSLINKTCKTDKTFFFVLSVLGVLFITNTDCSDGHGLFKTKTTKKFVDELLVNVELP